MHLQIDTSVFLLVTAQVPEYIYGQIIQVRERPNGTPIYVAQFDRADVGDPGDQVRLYYQVGSDFWCQRCKVAEMKMASDGNIQATFDALGTPRQEGLRRAGRIDAHLSGATASIDGRPECLVVNVGNNGMAVVSNEIFEQGQEVMAELHWNLQSWVGQMTIRHVKDAFRGSRVYGLKCDEGSAGEALREGLTRVTATVTFQQGVMDEMLNGSNKE